MAGHTTVRNDRVSRAIAADASGMAANASSVTVVLRLWAVIHAVRVIEDVLALHALVRASPVTTLFALPVTHCTRHVILLIEPGM